MRFYEVDAGEILVDDVNIKDYNLHDLRRVISLVMQEPIIFNYSILENVLYGKSDATNTEIYDACALANANEFIENNEIADEENSQSLLEAMENNKDSIVNLIGEKKYKEELEVLQQVVESDKRKGGFIAKYGDVD